MRGADRNRMTAHMANCPRCLRKLEGMKVVRTLLSRVERVRPSAAFDFALRGKMHLEVARSYRIGARLREMVGSLFSHPIWAGCSFVFVILFAVSLTDRFGPENPLGAWIRSESIGRADTMELRPDTRGRVKINYVLETVTSPRLEGYELRFQWQNTRSDSFLFARNRTTIPASDLRQVVF